MSDQDDKKGTHAVFPVDGVTDDEDHDLTNCSDCMNNAVEWAIEKFVEAESGGHEFAAYLRLKEEFGEEAAFHIVAMAKWMMGTFNASKSADEETGTSITKAPRTDVN